MSSESHIKDAHDFYEKYSKRINGKLIPYDVEEIKKENPVFKYDSYYIGKFNENGNPEGWGKIFWSDYIFYGYMKNGVLDGNGEIGVIITDDYSYIGIIENTNMNGQGTLILANGLKIKGIFKNNEFVENGQIWYPFGKYYKGQIKNIAKPNKLNFVPHGNGFMSYNNITYKGIFEKGNFIRGTKKTNDTTYIGNFKYNQLIGNGKIIQENMEYTGDTLYEYMHGNGILKLSNERVFEGRFFYHYYVGNGTTIKPPFIVNNMNNDIVNVIYDKNTQTYYKKINNEKGDIIDDCTGYLVQGDFKIIREGYFKNGKILETYIVNYDRNIFEKKEINMWAIDNEDLQNKNVSNNIENNQNISKKPAHLKSPSSVIQLNSTCVSHSFARSICRTFLLCTIIDGDKIDTFYILIFLLFLKINKIPCQDGIATNTLMVYTSNFFKYLKDKNNRTEIENYKYTDIPCEFLMNKTCSTVNELIMKNFSLQQKNDFFNKLYFFLDNNLLYSRLQSYVYSMEGDNIPSRKIYSWLCKKLHPIMIFDCITHAVVLNSWGIWYNKTNNNQKIINPNIVTYTNTWKDQYKVAIPNIRNACLSMGETDNTIQFICIDFKLNKIKKLNHPLYNKIINRQKQLFDITSPNNFNNNPKIVYNNSIKHINYHDDNEDNDEYNNEYVKGYIYNNMMESYYDNMTEYTDDNDEYNDDNDDNDWEDWENRWNTADNEYYEEIMLKNYNNDLKNWHLLENDVYVYDGLDDDLDWIKIWNNKYRYGTPSGTSSEHSNNDTDDDLHP